MVVVKRCTNGHFFDIEKGPTCSLCGAPVDNTGTTPSPRASADESTEKTGFLSKIKPKKNKKNDRIVEMPSNVGDSTFGVFAPPAQSPSSLSQGSISSTSNECSVQAPSYAPMVDTNLADTNVPNLQPLDSYDQIRQTSASNSNYINPSTMKNPETASPLNNNVNVDAGSSLMDEVRKVSNDNTGKTVGFFSAGKSAPTSNVSVQANVSTEPVVGWLVCVKGNHFGQDFPIHAGRNFVGRNDSNNIVLSMDPKVSREKHCIVTYDPRKRQFFIQAGDSNGIVYMNDDIVMQPTTVAPKALIELGDTKLMLIPLCGEDFSWEEFQTE